MKVREILVGLDGSVRCQIFRNVDGIRTPIFAFARTIESIRRNASDAFCGGGGNA